MDASEYCKMKSKVTRDLGRARETLWELCHLGLQQKLLGQKNYKSETANVKSKASCGELPRAIEKTCCRNSTTQNPTCNLIESVYTLHMMKGDSYESLSKCCDAFGKLKDVREKCGRRIRHLSFRDLSDDAGDGGKK